MSSPPSSRLLDVLRLTAEVLNTLGPPWALVGGLAVSVRGEPRFTRDIDIAVAVADDAAAEHLVAELQSRGFAVRLVLEQQALGRLATVRLLAPGEGESGIVVDLLFASCGVEPEICDAAEQLEVLPGLVLPVAQVGHLVAMKLLAVTEDRPQDEMDLRTLLRHLSTAEHDRALAALDQIESRGANRGKALRDEFARRRS